MNPIQLRDKLFAIAQSLLEKKGKLQGPASQVKASFMDSADAVKRKDGDEFANAVEAMVKSGGESAVHLVPGSGRTQPWA